MTIRTYILICFSLVVVSCHHSLKPIEYVKYVEDNKNGLHLKQTRQQFIYSLQYKPLDYVALEELRQEQVTASELQQEKKSFGNMQYFTFRISSSDSTKDILKEGTTTNEEYSQRQNYFDFHIQRDLKLIEDGDTLACRLCHCIRTYGLTPYADFVLAFEGNHKSKVDMLFKYDDKILNTGAVDFVIKNSSIKNLPEVKTE